MVNPNRFYTYAYLREDKTPYYIGKGSGRRVYSPVRTINKPKDKSRIIFLKQNLTEEEAFKHEIYMIAVFGRKNLGTGILYNKTDGGEGNSGGIRSEETKQKLSKLYTGRKHSIETRKKMSEVNKGKTLTQEHKNNISKSLFGRIVSQETRDKISKKQKGRTYEEIYGDKWEEQIQKLKQAQKAEKHHSSKFWKITYKDGREIIICGMTSWAKENNYVYSGLYNVYTGKYKKHKDIIKVEVVLENDT